MGVRGDGLRQLSRAQRVLVVLAANFAVVAVVCLLAEAGLRLMRYPFTEGSSPTENALAQFDRELGWSYLPGLSKTVQDGPAGWEVHFDAQGIRVPSADTRLDPGRPSVLFVGGSDTMAHGLSYEESFVGQFGALPGMPYQVVNLGVQAYGTDQAYLALRRHLRSFNTKVVVFTFAEAQVMRNGNRDRRLLFPTARFLGTKPRFTLDGSGRLRLADRPVLYKDYFHSYLVDLVKITLGRRLGLFPPMPITLTKEIIREMAAYCAENGVRFVMVNWRWSAEDYDDFGDLRLPILDTLTDAPADWGSRRIPGDGHPNAAAGTHVSRLLWRYFQRAGLL